MRKASKTPTRPTIEPLEKCPSGVQGLDEITGGGLPRGRPTLVCGGPGSGKTLLAMEFLVRGALDYQEPGLFVCFEETPMELTRNVASLGFDLQALAARKKLLIDHVFVERSEIEETGKYSLDGLFVATPTLIKQLPAPLRKLIGDLSDVDRVLVGLNLKPKTRRA